MPNILMGLMDHEQDFYAEELRNNGYGVSAVYSPKELLDALHYRYNVVVIEARYLFDVKVGNPNLATEIKNKFPWSEMFPLKLLVFFTYWDEKQARAVCDNRDVNALICHPASSFDILLRVWDLLSVHTP